MVASLLAWCLVHVYLAQHHVTGDIVSDVDAKVIDLSYTFDENTPFYGNRGIFNLTRIHRGLTKGGYWYETNSFSMLEHGGTHIDAPAHFHKDRKRVDAIKLDRLMGQGVRIDVREQVGKDQDYQVTVSDIKSWESTYGPLPKRCIILLYVGWGDRWPDLKRVFGTDTPEQPATYHFPGLSAEAAEWLVKNRPQVLAIGTDGPSIDHGQSTKKLAHQNLFSKNVPAFENVANVDKVPVKNSTIFAIPMKIGGGSGAPLRIFALVPMKTVTCAGAVVHASWVLVAMMVVMLTKTF